MRKLFIGISAGLLTILFAVLVFRGQTGQTDTNLNKADLQIKEKNDMTDKIVKSDEEWKEILSEEQYRILRKKGTERPFSGTYNDFKKKGVFKCAACGNELFVSETKYNSGCGWPSFYAPISDENIETTEDHSFMMNRTEVLCSRCGGHLGHIFDDGPAPTNLRYCINSAALQFEEKDSTGESK